MVNLRRVFQFAKQLRLSSASLQDSIHPETIQLNKSIIKLEQSPSEWLPPLPPIPPAMAPDN